MGMISQFKLGYKRAKVLGSMEYKRKRGRKCFIVRHLREGKVK